MTDLSEFAMPITTGLTRASGGILSRERAAWLNERLDQLAAARRRSWVASRTYLVAGQSDLTYTDEAYHRREVLTGPWEPAEQDGGNRAHAE